MKRISFAIIATTLPIATSAHASIFHYACKSSESRYALTVDTDRGTAKLLDHGSPHTLTTFRIMKGITSDCGKGGWKLSDGAGFCYATQGIGTLSWHGRDYDCDQADTE